MVGIPRNTFALNIFSLAAACVHMDRDAQHLLEDLVTQSVPPENLFRYVDFDASDETPLPVARGEQQPDARYEQGPEALAI